MPIRTDEEAVEGICELDPEVDVEPFIVTASNLVDRVCTESGYDDVTLELIERWLSAHFYCVRDPRTEQETVKGISERYEGETDLGLNFTRYGQMAMLIDTAGNLAAINDPTTPGGAAGKFKGGITHIGTNYAPVYGCTPENLGD